MSSLIIARAHRLTRRVLVSSILMLTLGGAWSVTSGCSDTVELDRASWLLRTLTEDHLHLVARDSALVAGKYAKMTGESLDGSVSIYPYFRGTLGQMYRDLSGDDSIVVPSAFSSAGGAQVFLVGDPHLENVSASLGDGGLLRLEWDDFDSAGYGPWIWDVRRLALSLWALRDELRGALGADASLDVLSVEALMQSLALGYIQGVSSWRRGERARPREGSVVPLVIRKLFQKARERAQAGALLDRYTTSSAESSTLGGSRALRRGEIRASTQRGVVRDALLEVSPAEETMIFAIERSLRDQGIQLGALVDYARRYGQGVSSYPLMRFYLLFEGVGDEGVGDEGAGDAREPQLWEVKELSDRPVPAGLSLYPPRLFGAQGARVIQARRALQWGPLASPQSVEPTTWVDVGNVSFRARRRTDYQRGLDLEDIVKRYRRSADDQGEATAALELHALAELLGSLLAGAHCFADTLDGVQGGAVISADLDRAERSTLEVELTQFVTQYGPQLRKDRDTLSALLEAYGPTLGARGGAR